MLKTMSFRNYKQLLDECWEIKQKKLGDKIILFDKFKEEF